VVVDLRGGRKWWWNFGGGGEIEGSGRLKKEWVVVMVG